MDQKEVIEVRAASACCGDAPAPRLDDEGARRASALLKALAEPTRLQILDLLVQNEGELCVCDLEGVVGLPDEHGRRPRQPTISHHLRVLREAGLVESNRRGLWVYYFVRRERLAEARALIGHLLEA